MDDLSVSGEEGAGRLQATSDRGKRCSTYDGYVRPVRDRKNLTVISDVQVQKIILEQGHAVGVSVLQGQARSDFRCLNEVLLSAGATNTPQLLMLSGIGDAAHLRTVGIEPQLDRPQVGRNMQDHCGVHMKFGVSPRWSGNARVNNLRKYVEGVRWLFTRTGYLAASSTVAAAFVKSSPDMDYADLEIGFRPISFNYSPVRGAEIDSFAAVSASVYRVRPSSRGSVRLRSADSAAPPVIDTNYLATEDDVLATVAGLEKIREIFAAPPLSQAVLQEIYPGDAVTTREQMIDFVRQNGKCSYHAIGTCRMGQDADAVVDPRLRVNGVRGLRVVDASVMPTSPSGNTAAATMMIAEKASDMIIVDAKAEL